MNTRNIILSGALLAITLIALVSLNAQLALAGFSGDGWDGSSGHPQIYLIKKVMDICDPARGGGVSDSAAILGGSMPPSGQQFGCVKIIGDRLNEYLFTGEQLGVLVAVRHVDGALGIEEPVTLEVDGQFQVYCNRITYIHGQALTWLGHDVLADLEEQPPGKSYGTENGFNESFDKLFECIYTATGDEVTDEAVPVEVVVKDSNSEDGEVRGALDFVWFNPEILVQVTTSDDAPITFEGGSSGQTIYSTNHLVVTNMAEGGVLLYAWLAGTDLVAPDGGKCPVSNVLDVDEYMEYRCKIGSLFSNAWNYVDNPDDTRDCDYGKDCQGADPLLQDGLQDWSFLTVGSWAECWFRLLIPTPCIGTFDQGTIEIFARAV